MELTPKTKTILFAAALALLVAAAIWAFIVAQNDDLQHIAERINEFGYAFEGADIYVYGESRGTNIAFLLYDMDLSDAVEASESAGFPSDIHATGDIVTLLIQADDDDNVITIYLRNGEIELCFIQNLETGAVKAVGE